MRLIERIHGEGIGDKD